MKYLIAMPQVTKIKDQQYPFPIGIAYVSGALKASGRSVLALNLNYKEGTIFDILKKAIVENDIDVVAVGGLTTQYPQIKEIVDCAKKIKPNIITWVGGGIITSDPEAAMEAIETADFGIIGEGEITICELAEALETSADLSGVDGIIYRKDNTWITTNQRAEIMDLDTIPFPDYDGFEFGELFKKQALDLYGFANKNTATVTFGRSCPFNCTFCFHPSGSKYRQRSLDSVFSEIDMIIEKYPIQNLAITDELFSYKKEYLDEFCHRIKKYNLKFFVALRVDMVTREMLVLLKNSGCVSVGVGLESADNRILKSMRKHTTVEQIENTLSLCSEIGIIVSGGFIFGDLEETFETANNTINWRLAHPQYTIAMNWIMVFPGSHLYKVACERGLIKDKVQYIKDGCPYINVSKMTDKEYKEIAIKIDTLHVNSTMKLTDVEIELMKFGKATVKGKCPYCKQDSEFKNIDIFKPLTDKLCSSCNSTLNILVADYIEGHTFNDNILKLVENYKVAVWPITTAVSNMMQLSPALLSNNVYLVDSSQYKQGNYFKEKMTNHPDIIKQENIEVVVLAVTSSVAHDVVDIIKKNYPSVKYLVYAGELIDKNFELQAKVFKR